MSWEEELARFDDAFCPTGPVRTKAEAKIPNGLYTIQFPTGERRTIRIHTRGGRGKLAGRRIISLLVGPDNEREYMPFGFVADDSIDVWRRYRGIRDRFVEYADLIWHFGTGGQLAGYKFSVSKRCLRCNRTLTTPESVERLIGPECLKKTGG